MRLPSVLWRRATGSVRCEDRDKFEPHDSSLVRSEVSLSRAEREQINTI